MNLRRTHSGSLASACCSSSFCCRACSRWTRACTSCAARCARWFSASTSVSCLSACIASCNRATDHGTLCWRAQPMTLMFEVMQRFGINLQSNKDLCWRTFMSHETHAENWSGCRLDRTVAHRKGERACAAASKPRMHANQRACAAVCTSWPSPSVQRERVFAEKQSMHEKCSPLEHVMPPSRGYFSKRIAHSFRLLLSAAAVETLPAAAAAVAASAFAALCSTSSCARSRV